MNSELVVLHDLCPRLATWSAGYALPRVPLAEAMRKSLHAGLIAGRGSNARETLLQIAARPGLDIHGRNVYDIAVHHAAMMEVVVDYLAAEGPWVPAGTVKGLELESFLMPDGRLRRVILCSTWNALRQEEELVSWRTVADVCVTGRPMLLNFIVIGQSRFGFRPSPWTQGFIHPENHLLRVKRIATEKTGPNPKFTENWKKVYREQTDHHSDKWLKIMQDDQAFEDLVRYYTAEVPKNRKSVLADLARIGDEIALKGTRMRRSACFRLAPCPFARLCHAPTRLTPQSCGWERREVV